VHQLRAALPAADQILQADANTLWWRANGEFWLDVAEFETATAQAHAARKAKDEAAARTALERAVLLYGGDLLPSCYDDWIIPERERLHQQCMSALEHLIESLEKARDHRAALQHAQRLLVLDPLSERAYLDLMRLHALNGDRASALRTHHTCISTLQRELGAGVEPGAAIKQAYARLLSKDVGSPETAVTPTRAATDFVGRQAEWQTLQHTWRGLHGGQARLAIISGEAGIGKSRLAEEMVNWADSQGILVATARAYAAEGSLAFAPVTEWLRSRAIRPTLAKLDRLWLTEISRLLPELLIEQPDLRHPEPLTEYWQGQRFFEALAGAITGADVNLLLLLDDLQWCDAETLEWLHFLLRFDSGGSETRLLVLGTARTEEVFDRHPMMQLTASLRATDQLTEIALNRLDSAETARLAASVTGHELNAEKASRLFSDTEGVPLFVVETMRASALSPLPLGEGSRVRGDLPSLPPKIYAVVAARLTQLSPSARAFAQLAATIGRAFTFDVLVKASEGDEESVVHGLDELWQRRIIREQSADGYDFSHDKIRDVAYAEIGLAKRRLLHRRVAQALEAIHGADLDEVSAQLAAHYERAGMVDRSISFYQRAVEVAQRVYAHEEAISLLRHSLALLLKLTDKARRDELELALFVLLSLALVATRGYGAPEVLDVLSQAQMLNQTLGKPPHPPILRALAIANLNINNFHQSHVFGEQLLQLAEQLRDPILVVEGHYVLGVTHFWTGSFAPSRTHLEQAIAHYDPAQSRTHITQYSQDPKVICLCRLAFDLWCLGYPHQARRVQQEGLALAQALSHPYSLAYALIWDAMLRSAMGEVNLTRERAEAGIALSQKYHLGLWPLWAKVLRGWAIAAEGEPEIGIAEIQDGVAVMLASGARFVEPYASILLAEQFARISRVEQGLALLNDALATVEQNDKRWCDAELHRLRGELLLAQGADANAQGAELAYFRAIEVAQTQQAKLFELRAVTSLAQLRRMQGKHAEARQLLAEICAWFMEGFDTPDLKVALALLERVPV
jgi:DNA-binding SARP family transcriptional activator/predicted ATPase